MRSLLRFAAVSCVLSAPVVAADGAQDKGQTGFRSLAELDAHYRKLADDLDRRKLLDMAALAGRSTGAEAETAYRAVFDLAVARGFYDTAEPAARAYLSRAGGPPQSQALAAAIALIARADRGEYDRSIADLEGFIRSRAAAQIPEEQRLAPALLFAVGEAYLQRLIQGGRYDIARKACRLAAANRTDPAIKAYFDRREARLDLIGKPAPRIEGKDVDGKPVRLSRTQRQGRPGRLLGHLVPPLRGLVPDAPPALARVQGPGFRDRGSEPRRPRPGGIGPAGGQVPAGHRRRSPLVPPGPARRLAEPRRPGRRRRRQGLRGRGDPGQFPDRPRRDHPARRAPRPGALARTLAQLLGGPQPRP